MVVCIGPSIRFIGPRFAQQLPAELSALKTGDRPRPRVDEETILASLRQEGLLGAPNTSTTKGGLCFEVTSLRLPRIRSSRYIHRSVPFQVPAEELKVRSRRPPPRLQRLEPAPQQTNDQIKQKLATAETRRKVNLRTFPYSRYRLAALSET